MASTTDTLWDEIAGLKRGQTLLGIVVVILVMFIVIFFMVAVKSDDLQDDRLSTLESVTSFENAECFERAEEIVRVDYTYCVSGAGCGARSPELVTRTQAMAEIREVRSLENLTRMYWNLEPVEPALNL